MKECMRELKAYKAAMQFLPSGCLAAEAEAEKQEKLSVEITGSQTGPMSCSEQTELFVRASGQKTGMVYTQKLDANASDVIAQALTNSEASAAKKAEPMAAADYWEMDEAKDSNYEQAKTLVSIETLKNKAKTLAGQLEESFGCQVRLNLSQTILTMGIVNTNNIEETASEIKKLDFADIHGQKFVKRACETAVSGMHNLLMIGPPGAGKTMTAMRIPGILPPMDEAEQMEISRIYSVSGLFEERAGLMRERPFRNPHHTITMQGLAGGGVIPRPGEISLAHKGVLFLDELPEFQKATLEILRQPMEEKKICIARLHASYEYPADFMLVAAMNPCKCGYYPDMQKCTCTSAAVDRYLRKVSRPLLDRIDVCVEVPSIRFQDLYNTGKGENSCKIRERVMRTQKIQKERYRGENFCFNSHIPSSKIFEYCKLDEKQKIYMEQMYNKLNLTARTCHKILRVARTLADMDECEQIKMRHLNEAICYRNIDRKFWEGMG